jgi:purine-binding chemotaxis protein CheW
MASRQLVVFTVNNEEFGVEITNVMEIIRPVEIFKIPNTPDYMEGLINLRGKVHTVFNLRKRFNLPANEFDENTKIIIVNINNLVTSFIADEVKEIIRVEDEDIESASGILSGFRDRFINGVAKLGNRVVLLLDLENTFRIQGEEAVSG